MCNGSRAYERYVGRERSGGEITSFVLLLLKSLFSPKLWNQCLVVFYYHITISKCNYSYQNFGTVSIHNDFEHWRHCFLIKIFSFFLVRHSA